MSKFNYRSEEDSLTYFNTINDKSLYSEGRVYFALKYIEERDVLLLAKLIMEDNYRLGGIGYVDVLHQEYGENRMERHSKKDFKVNFDTLDPQSFVNSELQNFISKFLKTPQTKT